MTVSTFKTTSVEKVGSAAMGYRFRIRESAEAGTIRIGLEQIDRAVTTLQAPDKGPAAIHETRKCLKRTRALLKLVRSGLEPKDFRKINALLREAAGQLAPQRDQTILAETISKIDASGAGGSKAPWARVRSLVVSTAQTGTPATNDAISDALTLLCKSRKRLKRVKLGKGNFRHIEKGLTCGLRTARCSFDEARRLPSSDSYHEWRKAVQLHWRHMQLLSRAWPAMFEARVELARQLSQLLGDEHDLSVLRAAIEKLPADALEAGEKEGLIAAIAGRQAELRDAAEPLGQMLFADRPKRFARRVSTIWKAARVHGPAGPETGQPEPILAPALPRAATAGTVLVLPTAERQRENA